MRGLRRLGLRVGLDVLDIDQRVLVDMRAVDRIPLCFVAAVCAGQQRNESRDDLRRVLGDLQIGDIAARASLQKHGNVGGLRRKKVRVPAVDDDLRVELLRGIVGNRDGR